MNKNPICSFWPKLHLKIRVMTLEDIKAAPQSDREQRAVILINEAGVLERKRLDSAGHRHKNSNRVRPRGGGWGGLPRANRRGTRQWVAATAGGAAAPAAAALAGATCFGAAPAAAAPGSPAPHFSAARLAGSQIPWVRSKNNITLLLGSEIHLHNSIYSLHSIRLLLFSYTS